MTRSLRALNRATVAMCWVALVVGCSSGHSHSASRAPTSTSVSTNSSAPTTTTVPSVVYRVKRGDTLNAIAGTFRVSGSAILARNHLTNPDRLREGQVLIIPPKPPLRLTATPGEGQQGDAFRINLQGAAPSETVTFEIDSPKAKYTGAPHAALPDGTVTATYQTALTDATGTYTVIARGNKGTTARTRFTLVSAAITPPT